MFSKNQIKLIKSLQLKKFRQEHQLFIAEGVKVIQELLQSNYELEHLYVTDDIFKKIDSSKKTLINEHDMNRTTALNSPSSSAFLLSLRLATTSRDCQRRMARKTKNNPKIRIRTSSGIAVNILKASARLARISAACTMSWASV